MDRQSTHITPKSLSRGLDYILNRQAQDGSWTDWTLPPGCSTPWTTAYVGWQLHTLPSELAEATYPRLSAAADWLLDNIFDDGGWGYNRDTGSDADSTAYAVLFLKSLGYQVPDSIYTHLCSYQTSDGGFSTYPRNGFPSSWTVSHPDVTPIALLALATKSQDHQQQINAGLAYMLAQQREDGMWNAFWWHTCLYATNASLTLFEAIGQVEEKSIGWQNCEPSNSFEKALLLSILLKQTGYQPGEIANEVVAQLIADQQQDGSWPSVPILRVTHRNCYAPWAASDSGQLYRDPRRLFTTATVLSALSQGWALFNLPENTHKDAIRPGI